MTGALPALAAALVWTLASHIWRRLGADIAASVLNLVKSTLAFLMLAATLWILEGAPWPEITDDRQLGLLLASGVIGLAIGDTAWFGALTRIGVRTSMLVASLVPVLTALAAWPFLGEPISGPMAGGMGLTLFGIGMVITQGVPDDGGRRRVAAGVALAATFAVCQSAGNILFRLGGDGLSSLAISVVRLAAGAGALVVFLGARRQLGQALALASSTRRAAVVTGATFMGTYLGIWLYVLAMTLTYAGIAATLAATGPLFALVSGRVIDGERASPRAIAGAFVAVGGVALLLLDG